MAQCCSWTEAWQQLNSMSCSVFFRWWLMKDGQPFVETLQQLSHRRTKEPYSDDVLVVTDSKSVYVIKSRMSSVLMREQGWSFKWCWTLLRTCKGACRWVPRQQNLADAMTQIRAHWQPLQALTSGMVKEVVPEEQGMEARRRFRDETRKSIPRPKCQQLRGTSWETLNCLTLKRKVGMWIYCDVAWCEYSAWPCLGALEFKWLCPDQRSVRARQKSKNDRPRKSRVPCGVMDQEIGENCTNFHGLWQKLSKT